jgi:rhodanese-related sulfurtransferase
MAQFGEFIVSQWMLFAALAIILGLLIKSFLGEAGITNINPSRAIQLINHEDAVVLDVRLDDEFKEGHVLDSVHIPVGLLQNRIQELEKYKAKPIIVNCRSGHRSTSACGVLRKQGFASVYKLQGGILAWKNANLPLTKA